MKKSCSLRVVLAWAISYLPNLFIRTHRIYKSFCCWSNGYVLFHDVTFREIRRRKGARFLYCSRKML